MRVLAHVHKYPKLHNAGAEWMLHSILRWLVARGHEALVLVPDEMPAEVDGIPVQTAAGRLNPEPYAWADLVITHLDLTQRVAQQARAAGRPLVHLVHNDKQLRYHRVTSSVAALVVFNSEWLKRAVRWRGPSIVCRPPVFAQDYLTPWADPAIEPHDAITLINLAPAKGAAVFYEMATRMPEHRFLGVKGSYAEQVVPEPLPANVTVWENRPDARAIYEQTRVLLMPSGYESWGRVAIEAAVSGIPTVGCPTPGLTEALGPALIPVAADNTADFEWALRALDNETAYSVASERARERAAQLNPEADLIRLEEALTAIRPQVGSARAARR